jgi:hypothetical protein
VVLPLMPNEQGRQGWLITAPALTASAATTSFFAAAHVRSAAALSRAASIGMAATAL